MGRNEYQEFYTRHLPHYQPPGATLFITFRLKDSLPQNILYQLVNERVFLEARLKDEADPSSEGLEMDRIQRYLFGKWDGYLTKAKAGPHWLKDDRVASIVEESIRFCGAQFFDLEAYCIMSNHVHLVCTPRQKQDEDYPSMAAFTHSIKRHSARQANRLLNRVGVFWQHESYDRVIRDMREMERVIQYVLLNPVSAGLVQVWKDWKWTYLGEQWRELGEGL